MNRSLQSILLLSSLWVACTEEVAEYCEENHYVSNNDCVACVAGSTRPAGDDATGPDTQCEVTLCSEDEHVVENTCVPCEAGSNRPSGDDASGEDTACIPCEAGRYDPGDYTCLPCDDGFVSEAGAVACTPCPANTFEMENECLDCPEDFESEVGSIDCIVSAADGPLDTRDYGYLFWPGNHWYNWNVYQSTRYIQTGYYGLALDVTGADIIHLGAFETERTERDALFARNDIITDQPPSSVQYSVDVDGTTYEANRFVGTDGSTSNPSRLIDMGRFMQRIDIPVVEYAGSTSLDGAIELAAMPRHFVLTQRVTHSTSSTLSTVRISLSGEAVRQFTDFEWLEGTRSAAISDGAGSGWAFHISEDQGGRPDISVNADGDLVFQNTFDYPMAGEELALSVTAVPFNSGTETQRNLWQNPGEVASVQYAQMNRDGSGGTEVYEALWDAERGAFLVHLSDLKEVGAPANANWHDENNHNWYNRHRIILQNRTSEPVSIPIAFEGGNNAAFYIVGGSPLFRDQAGEPTGAPIQISKNWHDGPFWYHLYSTQTVEPGTHEVELTFAHSKWGEAFAAAHAQLSLIGWGRNQQWDESSLGAFGESITYDPDFTLGRSMVDDVRPFLVDAKGKWQWTGNVGGANFLLYGTDDTDNRPDHQLGRLRTHYAMTGPNLTDVVYTGITRDGKVEAEISTQLGRTDDLVRAYYHLSYTVLEDVTYNRFALFQMAADRYADNGFTQYAYGDASGVLFDETVPNHKTTGYPSDSDRGIELSGESPWVMLYANSRSDGSPPENLANVAFVIRDYRAEIGGVITTTPHINIMRTYNGPPSQRWSQMSFELGIPYDADDRLIPAGSIIEATVEYLVPPADKSTYYGPSDYLTAMPAADFTNTEMILKLARDNQLEVTPIVGRLMRSHPVELRAEDGAVAVEFTLTGGLGYTPVTITELARPEGWRMEQQQDDGSWVQVDQSVEGNDYWQTFYDADGGHFNLVYNLHNRGTHTYRLTR